MKILLMKRHLAAGLLFAFLGVAVSVTSLNYSMGTLRNMGPGFLPFWLGVGLAGLGLIAAVQAYIAAADETALRIEPRQLVFILGSIFAFAFLFRPLGLILSVVIMTLVATYASSEFRLSGRIFTAIGLAVLAWLIFQVVLGLPLPLWPNRLAGWGS